MYAASALHRNMFQAVGFCQTKLVSPRIARLHAASTMRVKQMSPRPSVDEAEIEENFLKGSGPGGQKINKTASAVQLKHIPTGIVVKSQATRSRTQNRKIARLLLAEKLEFMEKGAESRVAVKAAVASKRKASATKKSRRKYRKLEEQKTTNQQEESKEEAQIGPDDKTLLQDG